MHSLRICFLRRRRDSRAQEYKSDWRRYPKRQARKFFHYSWLTESLLARRGQVGILLHFFLKEFFFLVEYNFSLVLGFL